MVPNWSHHPYWLNFLVLILYMLPNINPTINPVIHNHEMNARYPGERMVWNLWKKQIIILFILIHTPWKGTYAWHCLNQIIDWPIIWNEIGHRCRERTSTTLLLKEHNNKSLLKDILLDPWKIVFQRVSAFITLAEDKN